jgi:hypothetical protein
LSLDQFFSSRPMLGHADYLARLAGLYMCGSGTHWGGGSPARQVTMRHGQSSQVLAGVDPNEPDGAFSGVHLDNLLSLHLRLPNLSGNYSCAPKNSATVYSSGLSPRHTKFR